MRGNSPGLDCPDMYSNVGPGIFTGSVLIHCGFIACQQLVMCVADCICAAIYKPVCGKDGVSYPSACVAGCKKVAVQYDGECKKGITCTLMQQPR